MAIRNPQSEIRSGEYNPLPMPPPQREKLAIINADDFGFSPMVSEGILRAHRDGIVTSTTVAANMPAAEAAVARLSEAPRLGVGVHLNCTQGPALSDRGRRVLAGEGGVMNHTATAIIRKVIRHPSLLAAVEAEFDAQIRWALDHGIRPTHLDSHRHSHAYWPIFARVVKLARRYDIRFVRRHREKLPGGPWPAAPRKGRRVRIMLNCMGSIDHLRRPGVHGTLGTWGVAHTGLIDAAWLKLAAEELPPGATEIMTHPGLDGDLDPAVTRLRESRQAELAALCDPAVREAFRANGVRLVNYGQL